jgi:hypothetical protein
MVEARLTKHRQLIMLVLMKVSIEILRDSKEEINKRRCGDLYGCAQSKDY